MGLVPCELGPGEGWGWFRVSWVQGRGGTELGEGLGDPVR